MSWGPWKHYTEALPEAGDYVRVKCGCMGFYHEAIFLGIDEPSGAIRMAPDTRGEVYCYWSKKEHGDLSETDNVEKEEQT